MPYNSNSELPKGVKGLSEKQQTKWRKIFNAAYNGTCKNSDDKDACASKVAWSQIEGKYKKNSLVEFTMSLRSVTHDKKAGTLRWKAVASDTDTDLYGDNMSLELFNDFIKRIEINELVSEEFRSGFWQGGLPYLSISHYPDLEGKAVPGSVERVFIDGDMLKAEGQFNKSKIGLACYHSICKDLYEEPKSENPVKISIAFLDFGHVHKSSGKEFIRENLDDICPECVREWSEETSKGKIFKKGHLVHLALTRIPANERTSMEIEKSMATRKEDAASIIGEESAEEIEKEAKLIGKSQALVIKSEEEEVVEEVQEKEEEDQVEVGQDEKFNSDELVIEDESEGDDIMKLFGFIQNINSGIERIESKINSSVEKALAEPAFVHELDNAYKVLCSAYDEVKGINNSDDDKLRQLQPALEEFAQNIREGIKDVETPDEMEEDLKSETEQADLVQALSQAIAPLANKLDLLLTQRQSMIKSPSEEAIPVRRSLTPTLSMQNDIRPALIKKVETSPTPKLQEIVRKSTGLR